MRRIILIVSLLLTSLIGAPAVPAVAAPQCTTTDPAHVLEPSILQQAKAFQQKTGVAVEVYSKLAWDNPSQFATNVRCGDSDLHFVVTISGESYELVDCVYAAGFCSMLLTRQGDFPTLLELLSYVGSHVEVR